MTKLIDTPKCLLVEVPDGAEQFYIPMNSQGLWYKINGKPHFEIILPPGSYGQPILASEMTQTDWRRVLLAVKEIGRVKFYKTTGTSFIGNAIIAGQYLLESHNLQPSNTVVIPKK